jgi:hypothetical protein
MVCLEYVGPCRQTKEYRSNARWVCGQLAVSAAREEDVLSPPFVLSKKIKPLTFYVHQGSFKIPKVIVTPM